MKKSIFKKASIGLTIGLALLPFLALAQLEPAPGPILTTPGAISRLVVNVLNWLGGIVMVIAIIMLLWAAILYLTAGASETAHSKAKGVLIYAIVGIAIAVLAYSVRPFIQNVLQGYFG